MFTIFLVVGIVFSTVLVVSMLVWCEVSIVYRLVQTPVHNTVRNSLRSII